METTTTDRTRKISFLGQKQHLRAFVNWTFSALPFLPLLATPILLYIYCYHDYFYIFIIYCIRVPLYFLHIKYTHTHTCIISALHSIKLYIYILTMTGKPIIFLHSYYPF